MAEALKTALKMALISQLVLIPRVWWVASSSHIASKDDSRVRPQLELGQPVAMEAWVWSLGQGSLLGLSGGLMETRT